MCGVVCRITILLYETPDINPPRPDLCGCQNDSGYAAVHSISPALIVPAFFRVRRPKKLLGFDESPAESFVHRAHRPAGQSLSRYWLFLACHLWTWVTLVI